MYIWVAESQYIVVLKWLAQVGMHLETNSDFLHEKKYTNKMYKLSSRYLDWRMSNTNITKKI